jgi:hypothetical protein
MDRMLVVVFDNESKAYDGKKALQQLDTVSVLSCGGAWTQWIPIQACFPERMGFRGLREFAKRSRLCEARALVF